MMTRREALSLLGSMSAGTWLTAGNRLTPLTTPTSVAPAIQNDSIPPLARGAPASPERMALVDALRQSVQSIDGKFEARSHKSDWVMPYRLFRPAAGGRVPLVMFLHGSGGLGNDNEKQMGLGNVFGSRVWALPRNQEDFPCYVVVPQTDRGWVHYAPAALGDSIATMIPGLGDGARLALEIVDALCREFPIDAQRIYLTGQSMGGGGVWNMTSHRPRFFAAAVPCCGSLTPDNPVDSAGTPAWCFHGDADQTVPVTVSRNRVAALRKSGGHPLYTEYAGVGHNSWEWGYSEPALIRWVFSQRRAA